MILKNFLNWIQNNASYTNFAGGNIMQSYMGGNITSYSNNVNSHYSTAPVGSYVDVGFGNTPVTESDYKLANSNAVDTPTLTFISNGYVAQGTYPYIRNLTTTYSNDTGNDVTITEIGYAQKYDSANSSANNVLLVREVLDTPIVVPAGKTVSVTITMEI